jgi:hypothetical protein
MGIAMLTLSGLFQGFSVLQRLTSTPQARPQQNQRQQHPVRALRMVRPSGMRAPLTARPVSPVCAPRPAALRVLRVCDAQPGPGDAGRMVISGRMADVCAELDRLAAREASLTRH